jgi:signal transduction histidine kinase
MLKRLLRLISNNVGAIKKEEFLSFKESLNLSENPALGECADYVYEKLEQEKILTYIVESITDSLDLNQVLKTSVKEVGKYLDSDRCLIALFDRKISEFRLQSEYVKNENIPSVFISQEITNLIDVWPEKLLNKKMPIIVNPSDFSYLNEVQKKYFNLNNLKSLVVMPLVYKEEVLGTIILHQIVKTKKWTFNQLEFLSDISKRIVIAIKHTEQISSIEKQAKRESLLRKITENVRKSLDFDEVVNNIGYELFHLFNVDKVAISKFTEQDGIPFWEFLVEYQKEDLPKLNSIDKSFDTAQLFAKKIFQEKNNIVIERMDQSEYPDYFLDIYRKSGVKSLLAIPIIKDGEKWGAIGLLHFRTYRKWVKEDINLLTTIADSISIAIKQAELYTQVKKNAQFKSKFISNMSHEIKTPLNSIIGFSDLLLSQEHQESKKQQYIANIANSGKHILSLINDLLVVSKIEAGHMEVDYKSIDTEQVIKNTVLSMRSLAIQKNITMKTELEKVVIEADQKKLAQILNNLLSNAIKYTKDGGNVSVKSNLNNDKLLITVEDNGIGISEQDKDKVFAQFKQLNSSYMRNQEGTGLGLVLAKSLVEMHGGSIYFESEENKGSKFCFVLPKAKLAE